MTTHCQHRTPGSVLSVARQVEFCEPMQTALLHRECQTLCSNLDINGPH